MHNNSHTETNKGRANASHRAGREWSLFHVSRAFACFTLSQGGKPDRRRPSWALSRALR
jgi:hypothetical protein